MEGICLLRFVLITHIRGLITPLITTHEPPSRAPGYLLKGFRRRVKIRKLVSRVRWTLVAVTSRYT